MNRIKVMIIIQYLKRYQWTTMNYSQRKIGRSFSPTKGFKTKTKENKWEIVLFNWYYCL